jgi:hypothetical protein
MTINTLIDILTQIVRLEERRPGLVVAAAEAEADAAKAPAGYKTTIANCRLREATMALAEIDPQIAELQSQIVGAKEGLIYFAKSFATYTIKHEELIPPLYRYVRTHCL